MAYFATWEIVFASLPNSDGTPPPYRHRCIYLADSAKVKNGIVVLGITSNPDTWNDRYSVELPYDDTVAGGHPVTHLIKRSFAQAFWYDHIPVGAANDIPAGYVPKEYHLPILEAIARYRYDLSRGIV